MARVQALAMQLDAEGLFDTAEVIVSAGGSGIFDLVAPALKPALSRPVMGVLRSGCYVTHDDGNYRRLLGAVNRRLGCDRGLEAALEVWTMVQSIPEPGLAFLTGGRRDLSYDIEMPIPVRWCPAGSRQPQPTPAAWKISGMNDQHAHLRLGDEAADLQVGDRVALGISHPCTTFDKWRWMAMIDDDGKVVDALTTCF
jgi:D-serine dehydratase